MSAAGNWKVTINTPTGARTMDVAIATSGDTFAGKVDSEMGNQDVTGKIDGDTLTAPPSPYAAKACYRSEFRSELLRCGMKHSRRSGEPHARGRSRR